MILAADRRRWHLEQTERAVVADDFLCHAARAAYGVAFFAKVQAGQRLVLIQRERRGLCSHFEAGASAMI